ncbi:CvpA family protein [Streptococcus cameli]
MISLVLVVLLLWSFYIGYSRGILLQAFYTFAMVFSLIIAAGFYKKLAAIFYLWVPFANATEGSKNLFFDSKYLFELDQIFYAGLAFLAIYTLVYVGMRIVGILVHLVDFISPDSRNLNLLSGGLSVLVTLVSLQMVLTILATIPLATTQQLLQDSLLANTIIKYTPITTSLFEKLWVNNIIG